MCNRYILTVGSDNKKSQLLAELCNSTAPTDRKIDLDRLSDIHPDDDAPALFQHNHQISAVSMRWGFAGKNGKLIINARSETVQDRATFKDIAAHQRCALPASGYFEWRNGDHLRHLIKRSDEQDFYLAGLYRFDERGRPHFVVLTRAAYGLHAKIHSRMPCLLHSRQDARLWISGAIPIEALIAEKTDPLQIEIQGPDQLMMDFDD